MKLVNLIPLQEIDFASQKGFDTYNKQHKLRPDTKVTIAGKKTTAGQAAQKLAPVKGQNVFNNQPTSKEDEKLKNKYGITKDSAKEAANKAKKLAASVKGKVEFLNPGDGRDMANGIKSLKVKRDDTTKELTKKMESSPYANFVTNEKDNKIHFFFWDGSTYEMNIDKKNKSVTTKSIKADSSKLSSMIPSKAYDPATAFNKKVSKMTNNNDHSQAAVELATYMDDKDAVHRLQQIKRDHDKRGSITSADQKERTALVDKLLKKAKKELPKKDFDLVSSSF